MGMFAAVAFPAIAQDIEPRAYSNAPIGVNFLVAGSTYTRGGLAFDTALPMTDVNLQTSSAIVAYARVIELGGQSGRFEVIAPYTLADRIGELQRATGGSCRQWRSPIPSSASRRISTGRRR